jgi:thymidylate synthase (FAD)
MNVELIWATPSADRMIASIARVSNPVNQGSDNIEGLLQYMMREGHVSPFEMVNACIEITTTRDIGRQILRHRSFQFQEFSQRYATVDALPI